MQYISVQLSQFFTTIFAIFTDCTGYCARNI